MPSLANHMRVILPSVLLGAEHLIFEMGGGGGVEEFGKKYLTDSEAREKIFTRKVKEKIYRAGMVRLKNLAT